MKTLAALLAIPTGLLVGLALVMGYLAAVAVYAFDSLFSHDTNAT